jgi:hypothetical protein
VVWLVVGVALVAIGGWKVATVDSGEEVWGINVISPGIGTPSLSIHQLTGELHSTRSSITVDLTPRRDDDGGDDDLAA